MEDKMKIPTHIYIFEKNLSTDEFEKAKKKTKNKDFENITSENYPKLFYTIEKMCDIVGINQFKDVYSIYAVYMKQDFATLKISKFYPNYIFEYNEIFKEIIDEAYDVLIFNDKVLDIMSQDIKVLTNYWNKKIVNFGFERQLNPVDYVHITDFITKERYYITKRLNKRFDYLNLAGN